MLWLKNLFGLVAALTGHKSHCHKLSSGDASSTFAMKEIALLLCGHNSEGAAKVALGQLSLTIESFATKANKFLHGAVSDETLSFGPFCARVLLENSCAALVGRLDPFRLLYLSEFQAQPEYEHGKRARSGFAWAGDVIPDDKPGQILWSTDHDLQKVSRALFSKYLEQIYWKPAIERLLDFVSTLPADPALGDILSIDSETYIGEMKGRSTQLYSTLSKGVHWEFFTSALLFDELTVKAAIQDTFMIVSSLGLASHFVPTAYASLEPKEAVDHYIAIRKLVP